jgi:hypothetical protein
MDGQDGYLTSSFSVRRVGCKQSTFAEPNVEYLHPTLRDVRGLDVEQLAINDA